MERTEKGGCGSQAIREQEEAGVSVIQCVKSPVEPTSTEPVSAERRSEPVLRDGRTAESAGERAASPALEKAAQVRGFAAWLDRLLRRRRSRRIMAVGTVLAGAALLTAAALPYINLKPDEVPASSAAFTLSGRPSYDSHRSDGSQVQSGGEISSALASGVSSSLQVFAHGPKREQNGIYAIEAAAVRKRTVSGEDQFSPRESLLYSSNMATSTQLYFEFDGQGGYTRHDASEYMEGLDASGYPHYYRLDGDQRFDSIVVAYHSFGDRYVFDYSASSRCNALSASADGKRMALFDQSGADFRLLLFEPETHTLSLFPDAIAKDNSRLYFGVTDKNMSADGRFFAYMRNPRLKTGNDWEDVPIDMDCELWVWDVLNEAFLLLKDHVNQAALYWRGNTLYWEENTNGSQEYFRAALPEGNVRQLGKADAKFPAEPDSNVFLDIMEQHVVLRLPNEYDTADHIRIWNLESQKTFVYSFEQLAGLQLSLQNLPTLSDDGNYAVCPLLGEGAGQAPALYLAVLRTDGGGSRLYRLPASVPITANPYKMLGDQVFLSYSQLTAKDLLSSTLLRGQTEYFQLSLAPLPAAGS
ncbi:MAG: hypothetical protein HFE86_02530 [Clostridiales bacterium]|nr:hypothetical protein [Clostridiales bacterium]